MTQYYTGPTSTTAHNVFDFTNPKYRVRIAHEDEDDVRQWASSGGTKDGYAIGLNGFFYQISLFSDRDYFAYVMQWG